MAEFLSKEFLLPDETSRRLYHEYAEGLPIVDYHCHVSPKEIWEDRHFKNITEVWLSGDHYKWRLMRANGVEERFVTGDAPDREKFQKFAEVLPRAVGNPMVHWCHMELKNYFGYTGVLSGETAEEVWQLCSEKLREQDMGVRGLIAQSGVQFIGTTDDPADSLEYHEKLRDDPAMKTLVAPSFRPDKALALESPEWADYVKKLADVSGVEITGLASLQAALRSRMDRFAELGCRASDHGLNRPFFRLGDGQAAEEAVQKALCGKKLTPEEAETGKTALLLFCAGEYARRGWVMQLHFNCMRNPNSRMFQRLGPDTGFDCIGPFGGGEALKDLLDTLTLRDALPKTILYSLDGGDNRFLDALAGSFQDGTFPGKLQHGSAWWFNDTKEGIREQLIHLAETGLLGNFIGMLTDSRSFLSYARHEYFRRILCGLIGGWAEAGECPGSLEELGRLVQDVCCYNAVRYFGLEEQR